MKRYTNNSNFKLRAEKSVSLQFINEIDIPTSTKLHGNALPRKFDLHMENWRIAGARLAHKFISY